MRWWSLRLPGPAEQMFTDQTAQDRNAQMRFWLGFNLVFSWLTFALDGFSLPDIIWPSFDIRFFVVTPLILAAILTLRTSKPGLRQSAAVIIPPFVASLTQICLFALASEHDSTRAFIVLGLNTLWVNVLFPMRLGETLVFSLLSMSFGVAVNLWSASRHGAGVQLPAIAVVMHVLVVMSVLSRIVSEQNMRRSFSTGMSLQLHIEDLSRANSKLLEMSHTDPLTGLSNRRFFDRSFDQAWRRAIETRRPLAVMMIDVDHFKLFNDSAGHLEGDRCLVTIARCIAGQMRGGQDIVARFGGEEFVMLLPDTEADAATRIADRVHAAISAMRVFHPAKAACGFVSVSIGVAALREPSATGTPEGLIAQADRALYAAKEAGRNQVALAAA